MDVLFAYTSVEWDWVKFCSICDACTADATCRLMASSTRISSSLIVALPSKDTKSGDLLHTWTVHWPVLSNLMLTRSNEQCDSWPPCPTTHSASTYRICWLITEVSNPNPCDCQVPKLEVCICDTSNLKLTRIWREYTQDGMQKQLYSDIDFCYKSAREAIYTS